MACSEFVDQKKKQMLRRWLRHAENLSDDRRISSRGLVGCQVGNEKGSVDLIDF
jgi:hypothetical protein